MNRKPLTLVLLTVIILAGSWGLLNQTVLLLGQTQSRQQAATNAAVGSAFTYQGRLNDGGVPANGAFDFQFGLYDAPDLGSQIGITLTQMIIVTEGLFTTALDFGSEAFGGDARFLEIAVQLNGGGGYTTLTPRQPISAAPYASYADKVQPVGNIVVVAKSGGDFDDVSDALASITDASATNPYLIRIAPGVYTETAGIDLKSFVSIEGSGQGVTIIRGVGGADSPYSSGTSATVRAGDITAEFRHLTVESVTTSSHAVAIRTYQATDTVVLNSVTAIASGGTAETFGVLNLQSSTMMEHVTARAAAASSNSFGVYNYFQSNPMMRHVTAESTSGTTSAGMRNQTDSFPTMNDVHASGSGGTVNYGLQTYQGTPGSIVIHDSVFSGASASVHNALGGAPTITLIDSVIDTSVIGPLACLNSHNSSGQALDQMCRPIPCVGTYFVDRVSETFLPGEGITVTGQAYDLWTFAQDGTIQATHAYSGTTSSFDAGRQGAWSTQADGTVAATFLGLEEYGSPFNVFVRYDVDVAFVADCTATESVDMSLRLYDPTSENPLDVTDGTAIWPDINTTLYFTGTLITTP